MGTRTLHFDDVEMIGAVFDLGAEIGQITPVGGKTGLDRAGMAVGIEGLFAVVEETIRPLADFLFAAAHGQGDFSALVYGNGGVSGFLPALVFDMGAWGMPGVVFDVEFVKGAVFGIITYPGALKCSPDPFFMEKHDAAFFSGQGVIHAPVGAETLDFGFKASFQPGEVQSGIPVFVARVPQARRVLESQRGW